MTRRRTPRLIGLDAPRIVGWYRYRDDDLILCACGWVGPIADVPREMFHELVEYTCPMCDSTLLIRSLATLKEAARHGEGPTSEGDADRQSDTEQAPVR